MSSEPPKPTEPAPTKAEPAPAKAEPEAAPDPDEDDLSDLDDVLDEFAATKPDSQAAPPSSGPGRPAAVVGVGVAVAVGGSAPDAAGPPLPLPASSAAPGLLPDDDDDFARQLQAGMADLLGELQGNPAAQRQFERLVQDLGEASALAGETEEETAAGSRDGGGDDAHKAAAKAADADFQEQVRRTMERMRVSGESAAAAAQSASAADDDFLAAMLREMERGGAGAGAGGGVGSDEDFSRLLMGMMEQLTNKDILYEPMKELDAKFPAWLDENKDKVAEPDLRRYREQRTLVGEIVAKFEEPGYADEKVEYREYIVDKMQKV